MYPGSRVEPFVSIVTVSLNAVQSIEDTLVSVSMQRRGFGLEHVCVDGGSTDGTRDVVDRWAAKSGHINHICEPDNGIFDAMNKGLCAARGEYVMFLNADDFLLAPDSLAQALAGLIPSAPNNPDLIVGDVVMGNLYSRSFWRHRRVPRLLQNVRGYGLYPLHQGMIAKRRLLNAVGGFDSRLRLAADVNQYYDMERLLRPTMRFVGEDIAFMRAGGAANAGLGAMWIGTGEIYRHLRLSYGAIRSAAMVSIKTIQSVSEVRWGQVPHGRWFADR
jgi:glycosyltransferase involved in cell wall biosynthesis